MTSTNLKAAGELNAEERSTQKGLQSSEEAKTKNISATSDRTATPQASQIIFQPTGNLQEDEDTQNLWLALAFTARLGKLAEWKKLDVDGLGEVFALCLPTRYWTTNPKGELVRKNDAG